MGSVPISPDAAYKMSCGCEFGKPNRSGGDSCGNLVENQDVKTCFPNNFGGLSQRKITMSTCANCSFGQPEVLFEYFPIKL